MAVIIKDLDISNDPKLRYVDLLLDLQTRSTILSVNRRTTQNDIAYVANIEALKTRLTNLMTTSPGQMVLDPTYGCDLHQYMFDVVSKDRGYVIGRYIRGQIEKFVPQIVLDKIVVASNEDTQQYDIEIQFRGRLVPEQASSRIVINRANGTIKQI